jgi:lipoate---protein ligase
MKLLDLTLPTAAENLALDEALLDAAEADAGRDEVLRLWEPSQHFVVLGRSSKLEQEVVRDTCRRLGAAVLRRSSGGAAIVVGPGCLMYAVVLSYEKRPELRLIDRAHQHVRTRLAAALGQLGQAAEMRGTSDLVVGDRKVSGNSLRCKRGHLLYHGTLLYRFDLSLVGKLLHLPPRQPDYRAGRAHADFLDNLPVDASSLRRSLASAFQANQSLGEWPRQMTEQLVASRYGAVQWNERH